jgi:hypothetical protein
MILFRPRLSLDEKRETAGELKQWEAGYGNAAESR